MRARRRLVMLAALLLGALLLASGIMLLFPRAPARPEGMIAGAFVPPHPAPDFALQGTGGGRLTLARYRGKAVLLAFGFTYCAAVCPTTLSTLAQARAALGKDAGAVQVVFVTVDPARDDLQHLSDYLAAFDRSFVGGTDAPEVLAAVRARYGVKAVKQGTGPDYAMAHTSSIFLIDRAGRLRALMPFGHPAADFVHDIRYLLAH